MACRWGHLPLVRWLVEEAGCDVTSARNKVRMWNQVATVSHGMLRGYHRGVVQRGHTALTSACFGGHLDIVTWLVSVGCDPRRERSKASCVCRCGMLCSVTHWVSLLSALT
jgi:hypothetical protein